MSLEHFSVNKNEVFTDLKKAVNVRKLLVLDRNKLNRPIQ